MLFSFNWFSKFADSPTVSTVGIALKRDGNELPYYEPNFKVGSGAIYCAARNPSSQRKRFLSSGSELKMICKMIALKRDGNELPYYEPNFKVGSGAIYCAARNPSSQRERVLSPGE